VCLIAVSYDAKEKSECAIDPKQQGIVRVAYRRSDLVDRDDGQLVDRNLRKLAEPIARRRLDFEAE
jgi:hypothetical protein